MAIQSNRTSERTINTAKKSNDATKLLNLDDFASKTVPREKIEKCHQALHKKKTKEETSSHSTKTSHGRCSKITTNCDPSPT